MDITRSRVEGLLAAFPKLINTDEQHTFVETDTVRLVSVANPRRLLRGLRTPASCNARPAIGGHQRCSLRARAPPWVECRLPCALLLTAAAAAAIRVVTTSYVYQPMDSLFMVLITTKNSNILEDLETLRLFAKVVPEYCREFTEAEVSECAFELIFAFDEIVALGYRANVNLSQIRTFTEMDSHDENVAKMIKKNKENEQKEIMKRKAKEIALTKRLGDRGMGGMGSGGGGGGGSSSFSSEIQASFNPAPAAAAVSAPAPVRTAKLVAPPPWPACLAWLGLAWCGEQEGGDGTPQGCQVAVVSHVRCPISQEIWWDEAWQKGQEGGRLCDQTCV